MDARPTGTHPKPRNPAVFNFGSTEAGPVIKVGEEALTQKLQAEAVTKVTGDIENVNRYFAGTEVGSKLSLEPLGKRDLGLPLGWQLTRVFPAIVSGSMFS